MSIRFSRSPRIFVAATVAFVSLTGSASAADASPHYKIEQTWTIGGDGGWDYLTVDPAAHTLYLSRGNRVEVVDTQSGKLVKEITGLKGVHGIALNPDGKTGYISDGAANQVRVFDRTSNELTGSIDTGQNPDAILFEPHTGRVFTFNGRSKNATVIDAKSNKVVATMALPGRPEFAQADGRGIVFVNIEDTSQMVKIDAANAKVVATWPLAPCQSPSGMAIDTAHERLFSVCDDKRSAVVDGNTGKIVATPEIGEGPDAAGYDPIHHLFFSSNGSGSLTVISQNGPDSYSVAQTLPTRQGARTMALDPKSGKVYLVTAQFGPTPAAPSPSNPRGRPPILPGTFQVLVVGR